MATGTATPPPPREDRTIILAINQEEYEQIIPDPSKFRAWIDSQSKGCGSGYHEDVNDHNQKRDL
jgi:hypothetical protein